MFDRHVAVALLVLAAGVGAGGVVAQDPTEPAFVVAVESDGDATLTLRVTFDLTTDEAATFEQLAANATRLRERFADRMASVADTTRRTTGRNVTVANATSETFREDDVGVVELSVEMRNLAVVADDEIRLREPFAGGFETDRQFVVVAPEGYRVDRATPDPTTALDTRAIWAADRNLTGFEAVFVPAPSQTPPPTDATFTTTRPPTDDTATASGTTGAGTATATGPPATTARTPGFTAVVAIVALLASLAAFRAHGR